MKDHEKRCCGGTKGPTNIYKILFHEHEQITAQTVDFTYVNLDIHCCSCTATNSFVLLNIVKANHCHTAILYNWKSLSSSGKLTLH